MKLCTIDQSLTNSGIAWGDCEDINWGNISPKTKGIYRLDQIRNHFVGLFRDYSIDIVIIEEYAWGARGHAFSLGELGGVLKITCFDLGIPMFSMPIASHKKYTTGKGNTKKDLMIKDVYKKYKIDTDNDNEADAISMFKTFLAYIDYRKKIREFTKTETAALNTIDSLIRPSITLEEVIERWVQM
jgi:crossover junction endodeoxyribonuclease RuvC